MSRLWWDQHVLHHAAEWKVTVNELPFMLEDPSDALLFDTHFISHSSVQWVAHYFINVPDTSANNAHEENYWVFSTTCEILTTSWFLFSALVCYLVASCHINMYVWQTEVFLRWSTWLRSEIQGDTEPQRLVLRLWLFKSYIIISLHVGPACALSNQRLQKLEKAVTPSVLNRDGQRCQL